MKISNQNQLVIGHRGASGHTLENTEKSITKAIELGADYIEFDIQKTKDNEFVVIHDNFLFRLGRKFGKISNHTQKETENIKLYHNLFSNKNEHRIITLKEALKLTQGKKIFLELKNSCIGYENQIISELLEYKSFSDVVFISFNYNILRNIRKLSPEARLGTSCLFRWRKAVKLMIELNGTGINPHYSTVSKSQINQIHKNHLKIFPWAVNQKWKIKKMYKLGVDGVITNYPDRARDAINEIYKN